MAAVYAELKTVAAAWVARERPGRTLSATDVLHEALLRLGIRCQPGAEGAERAWAATAAVDGPADGGRPAADGAAPSPALMVGAPALDAPRAAEGSGDAPTADLTAATDTLDRAGLLGLASRVVRNVLVDAARRRAQIKRGGDWRRVPMQEEIGQDNSMAGRVDLLDLDEALRELERRHHRQSRVVEMRYFGGLGNEEIAQVLGVCARTVQNDWEAARAWLAARLSGRLPHDS